MRLVNLRSDQGSSAMEFVALTGVFLAPILLVQQDLTQVHLRQVALDALTQDAARSYALSRSAAQTELLVSQLSVDANFENPPEVIVECAPAADCTQTSSEVMVSANYKGLRSIARQPLQDGGSATLLLIAMFSLALLIVFLSANAQAADLLESRAHNIARYIVSDHFFDPVPPLNFNLAIQAQQQATEIRVDIILSAVDFMRPDSKTARARVCLAQPTPLQIIGFANQMQACATATMRSA